MVWVFAIVLFVFGLAIGSFMTVVATRVPAGESIVKPRSRCPTCQTAIENRDNIPVLGWVLLRGRCRSCGARIPARYPILELSTAVLLVGAFVVWENVWIAAAIAGLLVLMPVISAIDIEHRIIPNRIIYPALIAFPVYLLAAFVSGAPVSLSGMLAGFFLFGGALFVVALVSRGMGMGDVKLAALIGLVLGAIGLSLVGVAAGAAILIGGCAAVVALVRGVGRKAALPFGPALAAGAVVASFWGPQIAHWYQSTFVRI